MENQNKRIVHIDALRGLAMLLVVYSHSLMLLTSNTNLSDLNGLFIKFRMPLFFFIRDTLFIVLNMTLICFGKEL